MIDNNQSDFYKITDFENLYVAYKRSKSGKGHAISKAKFQLCALDGILQIKNQLESKQFQVSKYHSFKIYEPKERIIEAGSFKDKIVQHSICDNVLLPQLASEFILTNYAGQNNKGTRFGLDCLKSQMFLAYNKYGYDCWIIKADIKKFFYSIDLSLLKDIVRYFIKDDEVYWLCEQFINGKDVGLPLGNQISLVFALLYLSGLDHFVTGELGVKYYGRFSDDFYMIVEKRKYAEYCLEAITEFTRSLNLELNGKTQIIPFKNGIKFCGFHTYVTRDGKCIQKLLNEKKRSAKKKYKKMARLVKQGKITREYFDESYRSWKDHISYGNCVKFGYEMDRYIEKLFEEENTG